MISIPLEEDGKKQTDARVLASSRETIFFTRVLSRRARRAKQKGGATRSPIVTGLIWLVHDIFTH